MRRFEVTLVTSPVQCCDFFFHKKYKKKLKSKNVRFFYKIIPGVLGLAATPDLKVIFIILIITLNLHDPSLSEPDCNTGPRNIRCTFDYKVVS